jgi:DNA-binding transcriptional ArsR family regulator
MLLHGTAKSTPPLNSPLSVKKGLYMLSMFEKLINEHGSSTILKERLELFSDKYSMLEEKLKISEQKNKLLENENNNLKIQLNQAGKEIEHLKKAIESSISSETSKKLDEIKEKILQLLFQIGDEINLMQLCSQLSIDKNTAEYHLNILEEGEYIFSRYYQGDWVSGDSGYSAYVIAQEGRKYVVEKMNR